MANSKSPKHVRLWTGFCLAAAVMALSACGGSETSALGDGKPLLMASAPIPSTSALGPLPGQSAALAPQAAPSVTPDELFDWAEVNFAGLFPKASRSATSTIDIYIYRYYAATNTYLAVGAGDIYLLGPITNGQISKVGPVSNYACSVKPDACTPTPPPTSNAVNQCTDATVAVSLPTGFSVSTTYQYSGLQTGTVTSTSRIDGPDNFNGQSVIKVRSTASGTVTTAGQSVTLNTTTNTYQKPSSGSTLPAVVGTVVDSPITVPVLGSITSTTTVTFNPAFEDRSFTLAVGQSLTQSQTTTSSTTSSLSPAPVTAGPTTISSTVTFEATETISVLGKSYNTCRYASNSGGVTTRTWYIVGKGIPAKIESGSGSNAQVIELQSGTYQGSAL